MKPITKNIDIHLDPNDFDHLYKVKTYYNFALLKGHFFAKLLSDWLLSVCVLPLKSVRKCLITPPNFRPHNDIMMSLLAFCEYQTQFGGLQLLLFGATDQQDKLWKGAWENSKPCWSLCHFDCLPFKTQSNAEDCSIVFVIFLLVILAASAIKNPKSKLKTWVCLV